MPTPYARLNLRHNPFGELTPAERGPLAVGDLDNLAVLATTPGTLVQLRAPPGHGKTSHLLGLAARLPNATWLRADHDRPAVPPVGVVLLDEADLVGPVRRWACLRHATSGAVATHRRLNVSLRAFGFRVHDVPLTLGTAAHVIAIATARIRAARLSPGPLPVVNRPLAQALVNRHGHDLRRIEDALYDHFVALSRGPSPATPAHPVR